MADRPKTNILDLEKDILRSYAKVSPLVLVRFKAQAILLVEGCATITSIALAFDRKPSTVEQWLKDWRQRRLSSIFTGHQDNVNASKLTPEQRAEIQQALQSPLSDFGLPKEFWDVPQLKQYVRHSPRRLLQMYSTRALKRRSKLSPASSPAEYLSLGFSRFCF